MFLSGKEMFKKMFPKYVERHNLEVIKDKYSKLSIDELLDKVATLEAENANLKSTLEKKIYKRIELGEPQPDGKTKLQKVRENIKRWILNKYERPSEKYVTKGIIKEK